MPLSLCRFRLSMRGSSIDSKCEMMDVVGIEVFFISLDYHKMTHKILFYKNKYAVIEGGFMLKISKIGSVEFNLMLSK